MAIIRVQTGPFDAGAEIAALTRGVNDAGGIGCFIGRVRGGGGLVALTLEHYPGMTERALDRIATAAEARWPLLGCTLIHRIGRLSVGEEIVLVATASPHRAAALDATAFLIDWLKTDAPFWKSESLADGSRRWVEARTGDDTRRAAWMSATEPSNA